MPKPHTRVAAVLSAGVLILLTMWLWSASVPIGAPLAPETTGNPSPPRSPAPPSTGPGIIPSASAGEPTDLSADEPPHEPGTEDRETPEEPDPADPGADGGTEPVPGGGSGESGPEGSELAVRVPVLLYHHLEPGADGSNGAIISTEEFAAQMAWLKANGFTTITTAQLLAWLEDGEPLPDRPVMVTFDDGYRSNYLHAYPVLQQHGFSGVIFMVTGLAGQKVGRLEYLTWEDMHAMTASGVIEIQAHSHDGHRNIDGQPALVHWSEEEILADWQLLSEALAAAELPPATAYAYPFGAHDEECIDALRKAGVKLGFTVHHGHVAQDHDPLRLNRLVVYPGMDECAFARLVTGRAACE